MNQEEKILSLFDQYFKETDLNKILGDYNYVNSLGGVGITFEEYLENLNSVTAYPLAQSGICDDIAYSDFYNDLFEQIVMGDYTKFQTITVSAFDFNQSYLAGEDYLAQAA